jgi:hypothetical protein
VKKRNSVQFQAGKVMVQIKQRVWQLVLVVFLSPCAYAQSTHYSVLCDLSGTSQNSTESFATVTFHLEVPRRIVSNIKVTPAEGSRRIVILRDISGSMSDKQIVSLQTVKDFAELFSATDKLGLIDFSDHQQMEIELQDVASFLNQFNEFMTSRLPRPYGQSAVFDAIYGAGTYLRKDLQEGDSILLISDGDDNEGKINHEKLRQYLLASRIRIYWLAFPGFLHGTINGTLRPEEPSPELAHFVTDAGGRIIELHDARPPSLAIFHKEIALLHETIAKPYKLQFELDAAVTEQTPLKTRLLAKDGKAVKGLEALCPKYISPN